MLPLAFWTSIGINLHYFLLQTTDMMGVLKEHTAVGRSGASHFRKPVTRRAAETRPRSTKLFTRQSRYLCNLPSYTEDYGPKPLVATPCVRSGTSSGNRRNNPHPSEAFMVWRLSSRFPPLTEGRMATANLRPEELLAQQKLKSTYQDDYTGMQQGELLPARSSPPGKWPSYSLTSSMRRAYRAPRKSTHLQGNTTRYGCSEGIVRPACGVVPTLHPTPLHTSNQTWYNSQFGPRSRTHLPPIHPTLPCRCSLQPPGAEGEFTHHPATWLSAWSGPM